MRKFAQNKLKNFKLFHQAPKTGIIKQVMLDLERDEQILEILQKKKGCTVYELSKQLFVSESTVRRDLTRMEQKGLVTRTFGGAILKSTPTIEETSFYLREKENLQVKRSLVRAALPFIQEDSAIFLDSSSTTLQIVTMLNDFKNLRVITNGLAIANELVTKTKHQVTLVGGDIQPASNSVLGSRAEAMVSGYHAKLAIMSTAGVDPDFGFSEATEQSADLKRMMSDCAEKTIVLFDETKIDRKNLANAFPLEKADVIISSMPLSQAYKLKAPQSTFVVASFN